MNRKYLAVALILSALVAGGCAKKSTVSTALFTKTMPMAVALADSIQRFVAETPQT